MNTAARRIIFVNRFYWPDHSATSQMLTELAQGLAARGVPVSVVASRQIYDDPQRVLPTTETHEDVTIYRVGGTRFGRARLLGRIVDYFCFYVGAARLLIRLARGGDTIVCKTDPPLMSLVAWPVGRVKGATLVNWVQDLFPEVAEMLRLNPVPSAATRLLRWMRNRSFSAARATVVIGRGMARRLRLEGVPPERVVVIPNWFDSSLVGPLPPNENPLRLAWELKDRFVVGYSGNMGRAHDFGAILDAADRLRDTPEIVFLFIGGGAQRPWLKSEADRRGLSNMVFRPYQTREQLRYSLTLPDVHLITLIPALEGLVVPSKFYGAVAAGRPVLFVGDPQGELGGVIRQAGCGAAVGPDDGLALARHIAELASDPALATRMGDAGRALLEREYDRAIAVERWRTVLAEGTTDLH